MNFDHLPKFIITGEDSEEYADYVKRTATMLGIPYVAVHRMFEKESGWTIEKIKERYHECCKLEGDWKRIIWYSKRKKDKAVNERK